MRWRGYALGVGAGPTGETVGVQQQGEEVVLTSGPHELRRLPFRARTKGRIV